ncbi:MAG: PAS domain-containing protein [Phycisphaerales bacterium]|nr:PAS domain-containing protein [Phycisphaerales bacterium]
MTPHQSQTTSGSRTDFVETRSLVSAPAGHGHEPPLAMDDVLRVIDAVLWRFWPDGRRELHDSPAFQRIWGRSRADVERDGTRFLETVHAEDRMRLTALCEASHRGDRLDEEFRIQQPTGAVRWVRYRTYPQHRPDGSLACTLAVAHDVTDRHLALESRDQRHQELVTVRNRLARLLSATTTVHKARDEQEVIERVAKAVHDIGWGRVAVSIIDREWDIVRQAFRGLSPSDIAYIEQHRPTAAQRQRMFGPECDAFRVGRSYFIPGDELERERHQWDFLLASPHTPRTIQRWDPRNLLYIPLTGHDGRVIGYISMDDPVDGQRELDDAFRYLESFAELAAAVIEAQRLREAEHQRDEERLWLMRELDHRVRNTLAAIGSLAVMSAGATDSLSEFLPSFLHRIEAFASVHALLVRNPYHGDVDLRELVETAIEPFRERGRMLIDGEACRVPARTCRAMCMTLNELATNAAKYGALSSHEGSVHITWSFQGEGEAPGGVTVTWREKGGPAVSPPTREGIGTRIINETITYELNGRVESRYHPEGVECVMRFDCGTLR